MKKLMKIVILSVFMVLITVHLGYGQATAPSEPSGSPEAGTPLGGGAPMGNGMYVLLVLGASYGAFKLYGIQKPVEEEQ